VNGQQPGGPLRLTLAQFRNERKSVKPDHHNDSSEKRSRKFAHTGLMDQFAYGSRTRSTWGGGGFQWCYVLTPRTRAFVIDVDDEAEYSTTELARLVNRKDAMSRRGPDRYHVLVDGRQVPDADWPDHGEIRGVNGLHAGDILSNGHAPVPGSSHWNGIDIYEPVGGLVHAIPCTQAIIAAIRAAQQAPYAEGRRRGGYGGGGHGNGEPIDAEKVIAQGVSEGRRNNTLYKLACSRYRRHGTDDHGDDLVLAELHQAWLAGDTGDFDWEEVLALAASARKFIAAEQAKDRAAFAAFMRWSA
jgi:hypothetical protein